MITSFGDKETERLYHGGPLGAARRFPSDVRRRALLKLDAINGAVSLLDLRSPPGNRLQALRGDLRGLHSVRVNDQWRIVFRWEGRDAHDVSLVDYHS